MVTAVKASNKLTCEYFKGIAGRAFLAGINVAEKVGYHGRRCILVIFLPSLLKYSTSMYVNALQINLINAQDLSGTISILPTGRSGSVV